MSLREKAEADKALKVRERIGAIDDAYAATPEQLRRRQPIVDFLRERLEVEVDPADLSEFRPGGAAKNIHWRVTIEGFELDVENHGDTYRLEHRFTLRVVVRGGYGRKINRLADLLG